MKLKKINCGILGIIQTYYGCHETTLHGYIYNGMQMPQIQMNLWKFWEMIQMSKMTY
jgi:hypothetical protein